MMMPSIFGERLFDDFMNDFPFYNEKDLKKAEKKLYGHHAANLMKTDVREKEDSYELDIDLPGFKKEEITVDLKNGCLTISATKGLEKEESDKDGKYIRQERYTGACSRSFYVGSEVNPTQVSAKYEDGILRISIPKAVKQLPQSTTVDIM